MSVSQPNAKSKASEPRKLRGVLNLQDFERQARRHLPRPLFEYVAGTVEDGRAGRDNQHALLEYGLLPRILTDVSGRSQKVELFGRTYDSPFGIAPMGLAALTAYRGDVVLARAARAANIPAVLSGTSVIPLETVMEEVPGTWFQAYLPGDSERIAALLDRVARTGCDTLVVTVDIPVNANRENNIRAGFSTPLKPSLRLAWDGLTRPAWLFGTFLRTLARHGMPHFENSFATRGAPILSATVLRDFTARDHLNWRHFAEIRRQWRGNLVIKGILHPADAKLAREHGADAVIVSNHGGRQLDGAISPLRSLQAVVAAVPNLPVLVDSGFRRGSDVMVALAMGARMVFVGRPFNYAAAIAGEAGVAHGIRLLREEIDRNMGMLGINRCDELTPACLVPRTIS